MKELYILRHAESEKSETAASDHERALTPQGVDDARAIGQRLGELVAAPDAVITSTAHRAVETARLVLAELGGTVEMETDQRLYLASAHRWVERLRHMPATVGRLMIVGHNPGLHDLALRLARGAPGALAAGLPPAGLVALRLRVERWSDLDRAEGELLCFLTPDLPADPR